MNSRKNRNYIRKGNVPVRIQYYTISAVNNNYTTEIK